VCACMHQTDVARHSVRKYRFAMRAFIRPSPVRAVGRKDRGGLVPRGRRGGDAVAMINLGWLAKPGGNRAEAADWYRKAAEAGSPAAMYNLGGVLIHPIVVSGERC
jgi:TPR repeat protein